jgi:hypothetical protein
MFSLNNENFVNQDSCLMFVKVDIKERRCAMAEDVYNVSRTMN